MMRDTHSNGHETITRFTPVQIFYTDSALCAVLLFDFTAPRTRLTPTRLDERLEALEIAFDPALYKS